MPAPGHELVGGHGGLQPPDLDRLALAASRTQACSQSVSVGQARAAHAAQDVLVEIVFAAARATPVAILAHEERDVDGGRAGGNTGRIVAEIAAAGGDGRLVIAVRRVQIGEFFVVRPGGLAGRRDAGRGR